jgi:hypothetical protein
VEINKDKTMRKKSKKFRKIYKEKKLSLVETLRQQADQKNSYDCKPILDELDEASKEGEYSRTIQMKINQSEYIASLGLTIEKDDRIGYYKISW